MRHPDTVVADVAHLALSDDGEAALLVQVVECGLHGVDDEFRGLIDVSIFAEALSEVQLWQNTDGDFRRQRNAARSVEDVQSPGRSDLGRQDLEPKQLVEPEGLREPATAAEKKSGLLSANCHDRHNRGP